MLEKIKNIKKIKLRHLALLVIILSFNSYAWFVYSTKVSTGMSAHVTSWNVTFQMGEEEIESNLKIDLDRIYPGMETYEKEIVVKNKGEAKASLSYEIESVTILGNQYLLGDDFTSDKLEEMIKEQYPFKINIITNNDSVEQTGGNGSFKVKVEWPFESANDELDTYWGQRAYEYYSLHPNTKSLEISIRLMAIQKATT